MGKVGASKSSKVYCDCSPDCYQLVCERTRRRHHRKVEQAQLQALLDDQRQVEQIPGSSRTQEEFPFLQIENRLHTLQSEEFLADFEGAPSDEDLPDLSDGATSDEEDDWESGSEDDLAGEPLSLEEPEDLDEQDEAFDDLGKRPLYPGAAMDLRTYLTTTVSWASNNKLSMAALDQYLQTQSALLPFPNLVPHSLYLFLRTLGIDPRDFEQHVCVNDCVLFSKTTEESEENEVCEVCQEPRFTKRGVSLSPRKKFHYLPLEPQLQKLNKMRGFRLSIQKMAALLQHGNVPPHESFWGGKLAKPFLADPTFKKRFSQVLLISLGLDGVQCFKKDDYTVWPIGIKIWNLHPEERTSKDFIMMAALIPGPATPKNFSPYLKLVLEEIKRSHTEPFKMKNPETGFEEAIELHLVTVEEDQQALPKITEHMSAASRKNCNRCLHTSVVNHITGSGAYLTGYISGEAFRATRKTNESSREYSRRVEEEGADRSLFGIDRPSIFTRMFPDFDVVNGHPIEFFHKLLINQPSTFWKDHVFIKYKEREPIARYVMTNANRKIMASRLQAIVPTHDMNSVPLDPSRQKMKADNWDVWIHVSMFACEKLLDDEVLKVWAAYRRGYLLHTQQPLTADTRREAQQAWKEYAIGCEKLFGTAACTLALHQVAIEADHQVDFTGPLPETMASWIERLNLRLVEPVRRRRVCQSPETGIVRGYLLELFALANQHLLKTPEILNEKEKGMYDLTESEPKMLGKGEQYNLRADERGWISSYFENNHPLVKPDLENVLLFKRALFRSELHSQEYQRVRTRQSFHVAVLYAEGMYYSDILKFFLIHGGKSTFHLALVQTYSKPVQTSSGTTIKRTYLAQAGRIIEVQSIEGKVMFAGEPGKTTVIPVPNKKSM